MSEDCRFIYGDGELKYRFDERHPFNQHRLTLTADLLREIGALQDEHLTLPVSADEEMLSWIHEARYIEAVKALSVPLPDAAALAKAVEFGLHTEDTPFFPGMHEAAAHIVGGSVLAAEQVMSGQVKHALHLGGGLHHAMPNRGAGFCIYNDASVAIAHIRRKYQAKVLYVDTDVHHGDGVQFSFYLDPAVFTFSIHETGKFLFPGTGAVHERGEMHGFGHTVNLPMEPYTEDESWMDCFNEAFTAAVEHVKPDVIISQHGCDAHAYDPLAHIHCSMDIYHQMPQIIHRLAHKHCDGRWIALGGGGYDIYRVVPRAWSLLWLTMTDHPLWEQIGASRALKLPDAWLQRWSSQSAHPLPSTWLDPIHEWQPMPRRKEISEKNRKAMELAMMYLK